MGSTCRFMVMVAVSLEALQEIWSLVWNMKGPPEHLFADTNNDPSVQLWPRQPFHAWSVFILLFCTQVNSPILPSSLIELKNSLGDSCSVSLTWF